MNRKGQILDAADRIPDGEAPGANYLAYRAGFIKGANWADSSLSKESTISCNGDCKGGIGTHTCPYKTEINDNYERCSCCSACMQNCADDI